MRLEFSVSKTSLFFFVVSVAVRQCIYFSLIDFVYRIFITLTKHWETNDSNQQF